MTFACTTSVAPNPTGPWKPSWFLPPFVEHISTLRIAGRHRKLMPPRRWLNIGDHHGAGVFTSHRGGLRFQFQISDFTYFPACSTQHADRTDRCARNKPENAPGWNSVVTTFRPLRLAASAIFSGARRAHPLAQSHVWSHTHPGNRAIVCYKTSYNIGLVTNEHNPRKALVQCYLPDETTK